MNLFAKVKHYFLTQYMSLARVCSKCDENKLLTKEFYHADSKGSEGFSAQCKLCRNSKKRKVRIHPKEEKIQTTKVSIAQEINDQLDDLYGVTSQEDLKAFARVHDRLLKHFGRMYWMKVEADGRVEIRAYGKEHSEQFRGKNIEETIKLVLG